MKNKLHFDFRKLCFALALILAQCMYAQNKTIIITEKGQSKRYSFALPYISSNYVKLPFTSNVSISTSTVRIPSHQKSSAH